MVKDPQNPENEGKVKIWRFGKQVFKKIEDAISPSEASGDDPINPFMPYTTEANENPGAFFRVVVKEQGSGENKYPNYESSKWSEIGKPLFNDDDKVNEILDKVYDIGEFVDPASFKSYDELKAVLDSLRSKSPSNDTRTIEDDMEDAVGIDDEIPDFDKSGSGDEQDLDSFMKSL